MDVLKLAMLRDRDVGGSRLPTTGMPRVGLPLLTKWKATKRVSNRLQLLTSFTGLRDGDHTPYYSNLDITNTHNPPEFSTVYRSYVIPVLLSYLNTYYGINM